VIGSPRVASTNRKVPRGSEQEEQVEVGVKGARVRARRTLGADGTAITKCLWLLF
jgi:hypothetical protein